MSNPLFNRKHLTDYLIYGVISAVLFIIPVWYFLSQGQYTKSWLVFSGSALFMLAIMFYAIMLTRRRSDYKSTWQRIMAGEGTIIVGIVLSLLASIILCFVYIPGFMSGQPGAYLEQTPTGQDHNYTGTIMYIFLAGVLANFGAGSFINILVFYALKVNQTKDKAIQLEDVKVTMKEAKS